jgi:hypothetical protein
MIEKEIKDESLFKKAQAFSEFRDKCKQILKDAGLDFDKFTMVSHDSYIGYLSESFISSYLKEKMSGYPIQVKGWGEVQNVKDIYHATKEDRDVKAIYDAIKRGDTSMAEKIKEYFYDQYDILVQTPKKAYRIDVKTALTEKEPKLNWDFLYPVVQAKKPGKDFTILAYCIHEHGDESKITKVNIVGFLDNTRLDHLRVIKKGEETPFHTISQIDNFETKLDRDYKSIDELIKIFMADCDK